MVKLCECGCGQVPPLAGKSDTKRGYVQGQPARFVMGHQHYGKASGHRITPEIALAEGWWTPNPSGLCECGCGERTTIAVISSRSKRRVRGEPYRFVAGHSVRCASPEQRAKQAAAIRGSKASPETRALLSAQRKGEKNVSWKGGITPANKAARTTARYFDWRTAVFARDGYTCQGCGTRGGYLHAHHILDFAGHPELRTVLANGVTLCEPCHKNAHSHERARTTKTTARRTTCVVS